MNERIEGKYGVTTIIGDTPCIVVGGEGPVEKTDAERQAERRADRMPLKEVERMVGDYSEAKFFGFPSPMGQSLGTWLKGPEPFWSRKQVLAWRDRYRAFGRGLK
jgi:hypothetical protein